MKRLANQLIRDESGVVITAEIIIIATVGLLSLIAGWNAVSNALAFELGDIANSVGSLDQSFSYRGLNAGAHANCSGSGFADSAQTFTVNTVDVTVTGTGGDDIEFVIPAISATVDVQAAAAQAASTEEAVAVFEVERVERLNAEGAAVGNAAAANAAGAEDGNQAAGAAAAASQAELKSLLN
jgi:hypothetical protein